jgi:hypothetical protein
MAGITGRIDKPGGAVYTFFMVRKGFPLWGRVCAPVLLVCAVAAVFFCRGPVLLVADGPFAVLYGDGRLRAGAFASALRLFRPVKLVLLSDAIGADGVALAVADRAARPYAALFPGRYREGAELYAAQRPLARTLVLLEPGEPDGEAGEGPANGGARCLARDLRTDLYRAGLAAAALARGRGGVIVCITGPGLGAPEEEAFVLGVQTEAGPSEAPGEIRYISPDGELPPDETLGAVVFFGPSARFFQRRASFPAVLFGWTDSAVVPGNVAVIFDDSLPALAVQALGEAGGGGLAATVRILRKNAGNGVSLGGLSRKKPPEA